jgi:hypothetical protein
MRDAQAQIWFVQSFAEPTAMQVRGGTGRYADAVPSRYTANEASQCSPM